MDNSNSNNNILQASSTTRSKYCLNKLIELIEYLKPYSQSQLLLIFIKVYIDFICFIC